ncbi:hypothetical protein ACFYPN_10655 [Streptomyces sp. NPDC005576]|uniref:hypothetical protein n=1 Tax=unclassified Streptomyces TaxID=2593676 RepID=UPI003400CC01
MVRELDGVASVFLTDLARDAAAVGVARKGGTHRFGTVVPVNPGGLTDPRPSEPESVPAPATRTRAGRTIDRDDVLAATGIQLFGDIRQRALAAAREATATGQDG